MPKLSILHMCAPPARRLLAWCLFVLTSAHLDANPPTVPPPAPLSPAAIAATPDGAVLFIACATTNRVVAFDLGARRIVRTIPVPASPTGLAMSPDGARLFVTCAAPASTVCIVDPVTGRIVTSLPAGHTAMAPVLSTDGRTLFVCNRFDNTVAFYELTSGKVVARVAVPREPVAAALTPDGRRLLVANHLHPGRADLDYVAASVSVIDTTTRAVVREIQLPNGSGLLRDVRVSPDGHYAVVTHQLSRFQLPTTQVERGWINTNAVSLIDVRELRRINTVLLDSIDAGAANPWAAAWSADGRSFGVTHAGTHELSMVDFPALLARLARFSGESPPGTAGVSDMASQKASEVPDDLSFLVGLRRRIRLGDADRGPRALLLTGGKAYVANYFSDSLTIVDLAANGPAVESFALQAPAAPSLARRGEALFNDATICFQGWQSCASCHSSDARVDALNWDNLNDGIGNPKNAKSLLYAHQTPPSMWLRVRSDAETAVRAGLKFSMFAVRPEADAEALDEYLQSLDPIPSPRLVNGALSPAAERGKRIFLARTTGCAECHVPDRFYTDLASHDVGTAGRHDKAKDGFDTPTLIELWRSGPYLHDGTAATVRDVLTWRNRANRHGHTAHLTPTEIDQLVEFILSL